MEPADIAVIAGPPGAGKSTVARLVAAQFEPSMCLESDWLWTTITGGFIPPWEPDARHQNRTVLRAAAAVAARFAAGGYHVVLEGVIGPWNLDVVLPELAEAGVACSYVVLRPDLDTSLVRAIGRAGEAPRVEGNPPLTDEGPLRALWQQFADLGDLEHHAIDTSALDPVATAASVTAAIRSSSHRLGAHR